MKNKNIIVKKSLDDWIINGIRGRLQLRVQLAHTDMDSINHSEIT